MLNILAIDFDFWPRLCESKLNFPSPALFELQKQNKALILSLISARTQSEKWKRRTLFICFLPLHLLSHSFNKNLFSHFIIQSLFFFFPFFLKKRQNLKKTSFTGWQKGERNWASESIKAQTKLFSVCAWRVAAFDFIKKKRKKKVCDFVTWWHGI